MIRLSSLIALTLTMSACSTVYFRGVSQLDDKKIVVTGSEYGYGSPAKAIVLTCKSKSNTRYVCKKNYPAEDL
ncbi:hypothetical protein N9W41_00585 [bacterium]|nr:hypothetical protein [bacterium]